MSSRIIEPKMVEFLDRKLKENGLAQAAIASGDPRTLFRLALESCIGIRETSNNAGPLVELIQKTIGGADKEPWCMSLVQTGLAYAEIKTEIKSPIIASEHCLTVWNKTPDRQRVRFAPGLGAICIWRHGSGPAGHTGITISDIDKNKVYLVEGNTEAGLTGSQVVREGGGVYRTHRSTVGSGNMMVVGFLKPF